MHTFGRVTVTFLALSVLSAIAAPAASAGPVDDVVCYVKTKDAYKCFHWGP